MVDRNQELVDFASQRERGRIARGLQSLGKSMRERGQIRIGQELKEMGKMLFEVNRFERARNRVASELDQTRKARALSALSLLKGDFNGKGSKLGK